eukprot:GILJ01018083.1.p1 GENE.GILJ01018083.1~~GILJ01018083.1.p1  ORF type:complete len:582 (+),score=55.56 GILJ01018083.1:1563-3308(+)
MKKDQMEQKTFLVCPVTKRQIMNFGRSSPPRKTNSQTKHKSSPKRKSPPKRKTPSPKRKSSPRSPPSPPRPTTPPSPLSPPLSPPSPSSPPSPVLRERHSRRSPPRVIFRPMAARLQVRSKVLPPDHLDGGWTRQQGPLAVWAGQDERAGLATLVEWLWTNHVSSFVIHPPPASTRDVAPTSSSPSFVFVEWPITNDEAVTMPPLTIAGSAKWKTMWVSGDWVRFTYATDQDRQHDTVQQLRQWTVQNQDRLDLDHVHVEQTIPPVNCGKYLNVIVQSGTLSPHDFPLVLGDRPFQWRLVSTWTWISNKPGVTYQGRDLTSGQAMIEQWVTQRQQSRPSPPIQVQIEPSSSTYEVVNSLSPNDCRARGIVIPTTTQTMTTWKLTRAPLLDSTDNEYVYSFSGNPGEFITFFKEAQVFIQALADAQHRKDAYILLRWGGNLRQPLPTELVGGLWKKIDEHQQDGQGDRWSCMYRGPPGHDAEGRQVVQEMARSRGLRQTDIIIATPFITIYSNAPLSLPDTLDESHWKRVVLNDPPPPPTTNKSVTPFHYTYTGSLSIFDLVEEELRRLTRHALVNFTFHKG